MTHTPPAYHKKNRRRPLHANLVERRWIVIEVGFKTEQARRNALSYGVKHGNEMYMALTTCVQTANYIAIIVRGILRSKNALGRSERLVILQPSYWKGINPRMAYVDNLVLSFKDATDYPSMIAIQTTVPRASDDNSTKTAPHDIVDINADDGVPVA
ncbi:hypothetical protein BJV82DRAFT_672178 [Fennellomyces sp. T-0311]|nr:hypothetical protein BJV82DRAFT_672178 [Fennellomyces sp. T-0311]